MTTYPTPAQEALLNLIADGGQLRIYGPPDNLRTVYGYPIAALRMLGAIEFMESGDGLRITSAGRVLARRGAQA